MSPAPSTLGMPQEEESADPSVLKALKAAGMTPGVWLGIAGYFLLVGASLLTWYNISAHIPSVPSYAQPTTIIQFDGLSGLFVHEDLKSGLGLGVPKVGFPVVVLFLVSAVLKIRKIIRSNQHKMRAATLWRSSIAIIVPVAITLSIIFTLPAFIPTTSPAEAHELAEAIAAQPFGGSATFTFEDPTSPGQTNTGTLSWGFGPALFLMVVAAVLMNVGSQLEMRVYRAAIKELEAQAAIERARSGQ